jgi:uncharacterized protein (TIGR00255 family)
MTVTSMTGFARREGAHDGRRFVWELKSGNGRGLEIRFRLPSGHDWLEPELRKAAAEYFVRGSLSVALTVDRAPGAPAVKINPEALDEALRLIETIRSRIKCEAPRAEGVLALRGVLDEAAPTEDDAWRAAYGGALLDRFREAAAALKAARDAEGASLAAVLSALVDDVERLTGQARAGAGAAPAALKERIAAQLAELIAGGVSEERLAQEAALLAVKADIREELDRLDAHVAAARALMAEQEPIGRRLDFLTQEFNREANTLCAKAQDLGLKRLGLDLKTVVDRLREQVQNIE